MPTSRRPSTGTVLGFIALMVALGGTAFAATGQLVNIADGTTASRIAKVDSGGRLHVGDGASALTVDGTVSTRELPPSRGLFRFGNDFWYADIRCQTLYAPPSGSAGVLKTLNFDTYFENGPVSDSDRVHVYVGPSACSGALAELLSITGRGKTSVALGNGLGIPAGHQVSAVSLSNDHSTYVTGFGYNVPSSAVPATSESATPQLSDELTGRGTEGAERVR